MHLEPEPQAQSQQSPRGVKKRQTQHVQQLQVLVGIASLAIKAVSVLAAVAGLLHYYYWARSHHLLLVY